MPTISLPSSTTSEPTSLSAIILIASDFVAGTDRPYLTALIFQNMTNSRHDGTNGRIETSHKIRFQF
jgi:hypothetical protein